MARVYSWQINEAPKTYAYIVNPNNTEIAYIGNELTGTNLQKVIDWASTCTDTQYESQFNKVKALCESSGYEVTFETVEAYMNVRSSCDNLRGPSGRGIQHITRVGIDSSTNTDTYAIYYNDGTHDTFTIKNGRDGINGNDGKPGAQGDTGVSYRTIMAYTSGVNENGEEIQVKTPTGGSHDFITNKTTYPDGWQASDSKLTPPIWMSSRTFATIDSATDKTWTSPIQITGDNGEPGADGISTEFIYKRSDEKPDDVPNLPSKDENDYVPTEWGWLDSPEGVNETNQKEWYCLRKKKDNKWGKWEGPFIWSQYGVNGQDGDGVQYIYIKTKTGQPPANPTPSNWKENDKYQDKDSEWIPPIGYFYKNINDKDIFLVSETDGDTEAGIWADNPIPVTINYQYQWVSSRKYRMDKDKKTKIWTEYSDPALWSKFGEDGKSGTVIRKLYALSTNTSNPPDLPNSTSFTGDWGTGFPRDYKSGVNVVWGTEAEINISTNDFVMGYKKISITNENGAVIVPNGANEKNTEDVDVLPDKKIDKEYVRYYGHYYRWSGGWCDAYLVTGVMGKPGDPVSYNTYYFHYGSADSLPPKPTRTDINAFKNKSFLDNGNTWEDFPNTTDDRIDNKTKRWYQCCGLVGSNQIVKEWSSVYPCNAKDGETLPGVYIEMRFGTGLDDIPPTVDFDIDNPDDIRNPKLYDFNGNECGWYPTSHELLVPSGGHMYEIWAKIDSATNTVIPEGDVYWNGPIRISGEKGEQGIPGPAGLKGVSGIPGVSINTMFVLGTSKGPFAKKQTKVEDENVKDYATEKEMKELGWFDNKNIPYSDCIDLHDNIKEGDLTGKDGRVIRLYNTTKLNSFKGDVTTTTYYYYHKNLDDEKKYTGDDLKKLGLVKFGNIEGLYQITNFDDETDGIYVWCVQGDDVWELGKEYGYVKVEGIIADSDNTIILDYLPTKEEDFKGFNDKDYQYAVYYGHCYEWNRKHNTSVAVSATIMIDKKIGIFSDIPTEEDTNYDYILTNNNNIKTYYKWAALDGADVKHEKVTIDWGEPFRLQGTNGLRGLTGHRGQVVYPMGIYSHNEVYITTAEKAPYVYDTEDGMFYVYNITTIPWLGHLPADYETIMIHPDGVNADNTHSLKKDESFPTTQQNNKPYLYDQYGINGPKAYYKWNDETKKYVRVSKYKYSLSGNSLNDLIPEQETTPSNNYANAIDKNETPAWVRFESFEALYTSIGIIENGMIGSAVYNNEFMFSQQGIDINGKESNYAKGGMGFLDGYTYDNAAKKWKYGEKHLESHEVNPYGTNANGYPIHSFRPNVCINFATGQMWTACGKCFHDYDGTGYLANQAIKWDWEDKNKTEIEVQIGYEGQNGITIGSDGFKIGILDEYKEETDKKIKTKTGTWYGPDIPSINWDEDEGEYEEHDGDIWYCTIDRSLYRKDATYRWRYDTDTEAWEWVEINVPAYIFDRFDGKSTIFVTKPTTDEDGDNYLYHKNDLWILDKDYAGEITDKVKKALAKPGTIWVANSSQEYYPNSNNFSWEHWDKKGTELDNWVKSEYKQSIDEIKAQVDQKAETWYQDADPFENWETDTTKADMHVGDIWYNTTNNFTYILHKGEVASSENIIRETTDGTKYTWVSSNVPQGIFDRLDGKSTIFVTKPTTYSVGDIWLTLDFEDFEPGEKSELDNAGIKRDGIYCSIKDRENGFVIGDWKLASNYTDDTLAQHLKMRFEAMGDDGYISLEERKILKRETSNIDKEYKAIEAQAKNYKFHERQDGDYYKKTYNYFVSIYTGLENGIKIRSSLQEVIGYFTSDEKMIKDETSKYYGCIQIGNTGASNYNIILLYYQAKDELLNAFTEYANETAQGAYTTAANLQVGIDNITSTVMRMSNDNLLNGTEFNQYDISNSTNTVFTYHAYNTGVQYQRYENVKELNGYNYVSLDASNGINSSPYRVEIAQTLNKAGASNTFWKIKPKTKYTLHCKYRTTYKYNEKITLDSPGVLSITGSSPTYIEVNGTEDTSSRTENLYIKLKNTNNAWEDMVIKFTTGDNIINDSNKSNALYIQAMVYSKVDIGLLKLEEGHTPTPWRKTQDDISSTIKQTADEISLSVTSLENGLVNTGINIKDRQITVNSETIKFSGGVYFNNTVVIDDDGNFKAQNATFENIVINGSLASPFVLDKDDGKIDIYHDNYAYNIQPGSALQTYSKNLKWTPDQSGRKVTITNYKWNGIDSQGDINLTIPGVFNIKEYNGWERKEDYRVPSENTIYEVYSYKSYIPNLKGMFRGYQTHIKIAIPKNESDFTVCIRFKPDPYKSGYTGPFYIIISEINKEVPIDDNLENEPSINHENIKWITNKAGEYEIKFSNIPTNNTENFIDIAVRQTEASSDYSYECQVLLPKDKADEQFYYENGIKKTHLVLKQNELINLIGYGDDKENFYGWIVESRCLISDTNTLYGQPFKYLASGAIRTKTVNEVKIIDKEASHVETYDASNVLINVINNQPGRFVIEFDESWHNTISDCIVIATGYGKVLNNDGSPGDNGLCKATVMPYTPLTSVSQSVGIEIWISDDETPNHGAFDFIMFNYKQMPSARIL